MEVSPDNEVVLKDLRILCYKMVKVSEARIFLYFISINGNFFSDLGSGDEKKKNLKMTS